MNFWKPFIIVARYVIKLLLSLGLITEILLNKINSFKTYNMKTSVFQSFLICIWKLELMKFLSFQNYVS